MSDPIATFIIPVYNVDDYLPACIQSILLQSIPNFEVILVDDGSPDKSGQICDDYAEKDARVRVIHQENAGVSAARNAGLDAAKGQWICFVDGDDLVTPDLLEKALAAGSGYEIVCFGRSLLQNGQQTPIFYGESFFLNESARLAWISGMLNPDQTDLYNFSHLTPAACWGKLFRRELLCRLHARFPCGIPFGEDMLFSIAVFQGADSAFYLDDPLYIYRLRAGSAMRQFRPQAQREFAAFCESLANILQGSGLLPMLADRLRERYLIAFGYIVVLELCHPQNPAPYLQRKAEFRRLVHSPLYEDAIKRTDLSCFPLAKRMLFILIRWRQFALLNTCCRLYRL